MSSHQHEREHSHHPPNVDSKPLKCDCCSENCPGCVAERLAVNCGCDLEAKQYEYRVDEHKSHAGMGHDMRTASHADHEAAMSNPAMAAEMEADMRRRFFISLLLSIPIFLYSPAAMALGIRLPTPIPVNWLLLLLTTPVVFWAGSIFIVGAYYSLKQRMLNMSVLISTGVLAAYLFSVVLTPLGQETFFEAAALLVTFVLFGHWMEMRSRRGTSDALTALFNLVPPKALVERNGAEISIPSTEIAVGDVVILRPGDKVPVDGSVSEGTTLIDEALVTGESLPVEKKPGDGVVGGSINQTGSIKFRATKVGGDTVLAQIVKMVETAQNSKAPGQRLADRAAAYLVVLAVGAGITAFVFWFFGQGAGLLVSLTFAISTIVIACPDALGLATPTAVAVGSGIGARHNILIKDASTLEETSRIQAIILDKTGTLTEGKPRVTGVAAAGGFDEDEVIKLATAAERRSTHPLSIAVLEEGERRGVALPAHAGDFETIPGRGIRARLDGQAVLVGTERLMTESKIDFSNLQPSIDQLRQQGNTLMLVASDGGPAGVIGAADTVKPTAKEAIDGFKALGIEAVMITGDNRATADIVASELGIDRVFAEVLPADKAAHVKKLQDEGKFTAMVGDGINDAPALAQADIGIAIGAGTDVAIETAKVVLMRSDPADILSAIRLSKATVRKMKQNLFWAAIYNVLAIPVAAGVFYKSYGVVLRPEISALLMSASSIIVAVNAVSLKRLRL
ncbi:MAG: copper-translocating P-type ATPase [Actinomycetota bacterium]|nr:copper-translocating P-type ATPase [Actinomycetota bacterium]